ncbi:hypothetical protein SAMN05660691_03584 [Rheinheimera pacifica]|uniref:Uncharacterized protein n=1 Tax=Rheinheimera pacifica TaxID=173990 RepID=A0A1H6N4F0_9GAMM|nr:hypothetical protein [Rheinheimera pacifica]SEI09536.1 hypothetical protein SAMN05660691_03584 [Rheinheimera pacifica]
MDKQHLYTDDEVKILPAWHQHASLETERALKGGKEIILCWQQAKKLLRKQMQQP